MHKTHFAASAIINARPEAIYNVLADYHNGHPHIVPKEYLSGMEVEAGGYGAGTIVRYTTRAFGIQRPQRAVVSEPEPGRVLVETYPTSSFVTTFTVTPIDDGQQANVQIATEWQPARNLFQTIEQSLYPLVFRRWYNKELALLANFVRSRQDSAHGVE